MFLEHQSTSGTKIEPGPPDAIALLPDLDIAVNTVALVYKPHR
jgi:hypothetical protein